MKDIILSLLVLSAILPSTRSAFTDDLEYQKLADQAHEMT